MVGTVAIRIVVIVLALAGAAWLAVAARSFDAQDRIATLALKPDPTTQDLREAREHVETARRLNPDVRVEQGIGVLEFRTGDAAAATATFKRLAEREPRNAELWSLLARVARDQDPALAARAAARARQLSPR